MVSDDRGVRRVVGSLIVGVFFGGLGGGVAFPTLPALGPVLGITPLLVGLILSMNRFTRLVLNAPAGQILDTVGTRRPMVAGFFLQGVAPFGYVLGLWAGGGARSAAVFLLARALWGVGSAFVFVGAFSTVTHVTTAENRGRWVGYLRGGQSLGFPTGLITGGLLTDAYGPAVAFTAAGCAGVLAGVVAFFVLPDVSPDVSTTSRLRDLPALVRDEPRALAVGGVNLSVRFLFAGVLLSTVVLYAGARGIHIGLLSAAGVSGVVMAASVVCSSATTLAFGRLSDMLDNRAFITLPALAALGVGFAVLALVPTLTGLLAAVALIGVGIGGTNPPLMAYLGDITPDDNLGKFGGVYNTFGDLGATLGPLVALPFAARFGYDTEYLVCVGIVGLAAVLVFGVLLGSPPTPNPLRLREEPAETCADD
ncbi:MAG: MFS transporter [Haloarculaceae archaeon]